MGLLAACSGDAESGADAGAEADAGANAAAADDDLWHVPDPPGPVHMYVNGEPVDAFVVDNFLRGEWSEYYLEHGLDRPLPEVEAEFLADPQARFEPLVRGVVQVREAERRFPELDPQAVEEFERQMKTHAGGAWQAIVRRHGEEAARAHMERRLRMDLLLEDFREKEVEVGEDEVFRLYEEEVLAHLSPEDVELAQVTYDELAPRLRARLERERADEALSYWLDTVVPETEVAVELPDGRTVRW